MPENPADRPQPPTASSERAFASPASLRALSSLLLVQLPESSEPFARGETEKTIKSVSPATCSFANPSILYSGR